MGRSANNGFIATYEDFRVALASGTSADPLVTAAPVNGGRYLKNAWFISFGDGAGSSASRVINIGKNGTTVVPATHTLVLAEADTNGVKGLVTAFTMSTRDDRYFVDTDTLYIAVASGGTSFSTCTGIIRLEWYVKPQNLQP